MSARMVRGAMFNGTTPVKFVSGPPEQINLNQVGGVNDWRPVTDITLTLGAIPSLEALPRDDEYRIP